MLRIFLFSAIFVSDLIFQNRVYGNMIALQQTKEPAINNKALVWTVAFHALLLLIFLFLTYTIPHNEVVDTGGGLEVNLGTSDNGSGTDQPMSKKDPSEYKATVVYKSVALKSSVPQDILRSADADAPTINNTSKKNGHEDATEKGRTQPSPRYTYPGDNGKGGNSAQQDMAGTSEGNTTGPGDRGVPGGTPGADNYTGTPGNGTGGIGHTLSGRHISPDKFEAEFNEGGKVVIHVTVDKNGNIVDKRVKSSSGAHLTRIAMEKLSNARFSRSSGSEPQQFGDVTIIFKTRR
ncbi:MAG: energy transducer TonB [Taibaiella sp.]|nr:energy transducer TonB [Taibaiella sp.]